MRKTKKLILIACDAGLADDMARLILSSVELGEIPDWVQMVPPGHIKPTGKTDFMADAPARQTMMAAHMPKNTDLVIDYEHQTLSGSEAPAAGWIKEVQDRGDGPEGGIWARVDWTDRAKEYLRKREYRYLSPVVLIRKKDKRAVELLGAGLTNMPAIDGMVPVVNKHGAEAPGHKEETDMKWLNALLGLPDTATEEQVQAACKAKFGLLDGVFVALALKADAVATDVTAALEALKAPAVPGEIVEALGLGKDATISTCKGTILSLKNAGGGPTREEFDALKSRQAEKDAEEAVSAALKAGKITPAMVDGWGRKLAKDDPEAFGAYCKSTADGAFIRTCEFIPDKEVLSQDGLTAEDLAVCKAMGGNTKELEKFKADKKGGN